MASRLDYRPNQIARKLVTGRSGIVGLVMQHPRALATDSTFMHVVSGISAALAVRNVDLLLHVSVDSDVVAPYRRLVSKGTLDGFILNAPTPGDPRVAYLESEHIPFVMHGSHSSDAKYPFFDVDNYAVSEMAVQLLCDLGHRRIALLNGPKDLAYAADRMRGFTDTVASRDVNVPEGFVIHGTLTETHGYLSALRTLNGTMGPRPTAYLCASTLIAGGVLRAASDSGLTVPDDLSIIAHDDDVPGLEAAGLSPPLTVTRSALTDACSPLAELLLQAIDGHVQPEALQRTSRPELIVRQSAGPTTDIATWDRRE
jgi:LacI family transcriptional regulator